MIRSELSIFSVLLAGYALWVFGMFGAALVRGSGWRKRDRISNKLRPRIREVLVDYLAGSDNRAEIRALLQESREDFGDGLFAFQASVGGGARDRLCDLALEQALVHDWLQDARSKDLLRRRVAFERLSFVCSYEPCWRVAGDLMAESLDDADADVRISAALGLLQYGETEQVERVFHAALSGCLVTRILLTEELRRHSVTLCGQAIPDVLNSDDAGATLAALEILSAWERALPLPGLGAVLTHPDREIRLRALRLTPFVPLTKESQKAVLQGLGESDPEFAAAACHAAGRLRMEAGIATLAGWVRSGESSVARAAAEALFAMPAKGWAALKELAEGDDPAGAAMAREALAHAPLQESF